MLDLSILALPRRLEAAIRAECRRVGRASYDAARPGHDLTQEQAQSLVARACPCAPTLRPAEAVAASLDWDGSTILDQAWAARLSPRTRASWEALPAERRAEAEEAAYDLARLEDARLTIRFAETGRA